MTKILFTYLLLFSFFTQNGFANTINFICDPWERMDGAKFNKSFGVKLTKEYLNIENRKYPALNKEHTPYTWSQYQLYWRSRGGNVFLLQGTFSDGKFFPNDVAELKYIRIKKIENMGTFFNAYDTHITQCQRFD